MQTNWTNPSSYKYSSAALFSSKAVKGPIEDMFMYRDKRGGYHVSKTKHAAFLLLFSAFLFFLGGGGSLYTPKSTKVW